MLFRSRKRQLRFGCLPRRRHFRCAAFLESGAEWCARLQISEAFAPRINVNNCTGIKFDRGKKQDFSNATRPIQRN